MQTTKMNTSVNDYFDAIIILKNNSIALVEDGFEIVDAEINRTSSKGIGYALGCCPRYIYQVRIEATKELEDE